MSDGKPYERVSEDSESNPACPESTRDAFGHNGQLSILIAAALVFVILLGRVSFKDAKDAVEKGDRVEVKQKASK